MATPKKRSRQWNIGDLLDIGKRSDATHLKAIPVLILEAWVQGEREEGVANHVRTDTLARRLVDSKLVAASRARRTSNLVGALTKIQSGRNLTSPSLIKSQGRGVSWINLPHYEPLLQEYRRAYRDRYPEDYRKLFPEGEPKWEPSARSKGFPWRKTLTVGSILAMFTLLLNVVQLRRDASETKQQRSAQGTANALNVQQVEVLKTIVAIQTKAVVFPEGPTATAGVQELQTPVAELHRLETAVPLQTTEAAGASDMPGTWRSGDDFGTGCIDSETWIPYDGKEDLVENGCLRLEDWGVFARDGGFLLSVGPTSNYQWHGIHTTLPPHADIQFNIRIDELQTKGLQDANIALGVVSTVDFSASRFLFYRVTNSVSSVDVTLAEWGLTNRNSIQDYAMGTDQQVKFSIHNSVLNIFLDGEQVADPIDLRSMGDSPKAFWIGYALSVNASLSALISDFSVTQR